MMRGYELEQLLREGGEQLDAVLPDDREILDAHAAEPVEIDPRLDRDGVARFERVGRLGREPRRFVHHHPDTVAEPVPELGAETGGHDRVASQRVRLDTGHSRLDPVAGPQLGCQADLVGLAQARRQVAGRERPGAVADVAVDAHAPVDGHERVPLDDLVARIRVRPGAVRA